MFAPPPSAMTLERSAHEQLESFLDEFTPDVAAVARSALKKVRKQLPPSVELVYDNYNGLVIGFAPSRRPSAAVLSVAVYATHVSVCFLFGARISDPLHMLLGSGNRVRHIKLASAKDLDRPEIRDLVARSAKSGPVKFTASQPRELVIQSISPKRRPRRPLST